MKSSILRIINENSIIIMLVGLYVISGYIIKYFFDIYEIMQLRLFYKVLAEISFTFSLLFIFIQILCRKTRKYVNFESATGFFIILFLAAPFNSTFASIKQVIPLIHDFHWDPSLMQADFIIHFHQHPWILLDSIIYNEKLLRIVDILYMLWFPILVFFCLWMAWSSNRILRLQFFVSSLLVWILLGSLMATIFSSAGPCYYAKVVEVERTANPYEPMLALLHSYHESKTLWAVANQSGIWENKISGSWLPFGGISAMPSIHVAMAIIFMLTAWRVNTLSGILFTFYAIIIQIGSIVLAWHYAIDGYFSIIATILVWLAVAKLITQLSGITFAGRDHVSPPPNSRRRACNNSAGP